MVEDVTEEAEELNVKLNRSEARKILASLEKRLEETMISAGWNIIQDALFELSTARNPRV